MDRNMAAALLLACASALASFAFHENTESSVRHAFLLALPVAIIAYPAVLEAGFRSTFRGHVHGGESPTPGAMVRIGAWILLVVIVVVHHCLGISPVRA